jgi:CDP-glucose 4,6-dehydratase
VNSEFWRDRRVLVTGHTGFKGAWLSLWLHTHGARVFGMALEPDDESLFSRLRLQGDIDHGICDIRNADAVQQRVESVRPEFVFHLAAQSLVRRSYGEPAETWRTNVLGTAHLLEALRHVAPRCVAVMITTDKVYENREWVHAYRENDALGGHDPYSASKAAAEIAVASWRASFGQDPPWALATARAGNVVGGGDWAEDRIVPDCIRALRRGQPVHLRNPGARRPWQHVLEPLGAYLLLAERLWQRQNEGDIAGVRRLATRCCATGRAR